MRPLLLSLFLSLSNSADAGSICADGTHTVAEGQGACSWHGGVVSLCGGIEQIGDSSVYSIRSPCPVEKSSAAQAMIHAGQVKADLSLEQAKLEAESDCRNYGFCDYDIISRSRRIYACSSQSESRLNENYVCSLTYREEKTAIENLESLFRFLKEKAGESYTSEIAKILMREAQTVCYHERTQSILVKKTGVFLVYSRNRKRIVDRLEPEKFDIVSTWFEEESCVSFWGVKR
jgi:hypothetical protein